MAYRAEIDIAIKGAAQLQQFQGKLERTASAVDNLNRFLTLFASKADGIPRSIQNLNAQLSEAAKNFNEVALGTDEATIAAVEYAQATKNLNQGLAERSALLKEVVESERKAGLASKGIREATQFAGPIGPGPASSILGGQSSPVGDRIQRSLQAARELDEVYASIDRIAAKSVATENERVEALGKGTQEVVELANSYRNVTGQAKTQKQLQNEIRRKIIETKQAASEEARVRSRDYLERLRLAESLGQERRDALLLAAREEETERKINAAIERRLRQEQQLEAAQKRRQRLTEDLALGAGFPLLFGGGAGAVLGGVAGAVAGGGKGGFGLQILFSAIGQQFDKFAQQAKELGQALNPLTADLEKVLEAAGTAGAESGELARLLQELGQEEDALAVATQDLIRVVGIDGVDALREFGSETGELNTAINKLVLDIQVGIAKLANAAVAFTGTPEQRQVRESIDQARGLIRSGEASPELIAAFEKRTSGTDITGAFGAITETEREIVRLVQEANNERLNGLRIETQRLEQAKNADQIAKETASNRASLESFDRQVRIFELGNSLLDQRVVALKKEDIIARGNADTQALALELEKVRGNLAAEEQVQTEIQARNRQTDLELRQLSLSVQQAVTAETKRTTKEEEKLQRLRERERQRAEELREKNEARKVQIKGDIIASLSNQLALEIAIGEGTKEQVEQQQEINRLVEKTDKGMRPIIENYFKKINAQKELNKEASKMQAIYDQIGQSIASGVVDTLSAAVDQTKSLADAAANTLRNIANILLQLGINTALQGTGLGIFKNLQTFAAGGRPPVGKPSIVGERGPELFVPSTSGTIVPNGEFGMGGSTNIVVNVDAKGTNAEGPGRGKELGTAIGAAVQAELIKQKRPGGLLN